jgi:hypothetical protein
MATTLREAVAYECLVLFEKRLKEPVIWMITVLDVFIGIGYYCRNRHDPHKGESTFAKLIFTLFSTPLRGEKQEMDF